MFHSRLVREIGVTLAIKLLLLTALWFAFFRDHQPPPPLADHLLAPASATVATTHRPGA